MEKIEGTYTVSNNQPTVPRVFLPRKSEVSEEVIEKTLDHYLQDIPNHVSQS